MAVAMEVAWRAGGGGGGVGELGSSSTPPGVSIQDVEASLKMKNNVGSANKMNKRAWGADAHKLVQLMMNPLQQQQQRQQQLHAGGNLEAKKVADEEEEEEVDEEEEEVTLDLLGPSSPPTKLQKLEEEKDEVRELEPRGAELEPRFREFLELEPADHPLPLPSGWEKCLDLKTGKLYFVNKSTGMTTSTEITNKLKSSSEAEEEQEQEEEELIQTPTCPQLALISSKSPLLAFSTGSNQLNIIKTAQGEHHHAKDQEISNSKFALDLNLTASGSTSPSHHQPSQQQQQQQQQPEHQHQNQQQQQQQQDQVEQLRPESSSAAVCTMEMVQRALNRAEKAMGKREMQAPRNSHHHHNHHHRHHHHHSAAAGSSSSSSAHVGGAMSEATSSRSPISTTSSSNSSSTSSRSSAGLFGGSGVAAATTATTATTKGGILDVLKEEQTVDDPLVVTSELGVRGGEVSKEDSWEKKVEDGTDESETMASGQSMLVMGACTRCLMYVMLNKCDPKCPRCESQVPLDFTNATHPPASKRQRVELPESASEHAQA